MEATLIFAIVGVILVGIIIALIAYTVVIRTTRINPKSCPATGGDFAVQPTKSGTSLKTCGSSGTSPCVFNQQNSLEAAITTCNGVPGCSAFTYYPAGKAMHIIDSSQPLVTATGVDTYIRQIPVIFE